MAESPVLEVVLADDSSTRASFVAAFEPQAREFAKNIDVAISRWRAIDRMVQERREPTEDYACVAAITFTSVNLLIQSVQCFLGGQAMASGNLARQSIESIAVAILCADQFLPVRRAFMTMRYSSTGALHELKRRARRYNLNDEGLEQLIQAKKFYDKLSHPTALTVAHGVEIGGGAITFLGAAFDPAKIDGYRDEIESIVSLSATFPSFMAKVRSQLEAWNPSRP